MRAAAPAVIVSGKPRYLCARLAWTRERRGELGCAREAARSVAASSRSEPPPPQSDAAAVAERASERFFFFFFFAPTRRRRRRRRQRSPVATRNLRVAAAARALSFERAAARLILPQARSDHLLLRATCCFDSAAAAAAVAMPNVRVQAPSAPPTNGFAVRQAASDLCRRLAAAFDARCRQRRRAGARRRQRLDNPIGSRASTSDGDVCFYAHAANGPQCKRRRPTLKSPAGRRRT